MEVALGGGCAITVAEVRLGSGCANTGVCAITVASEVRVDTDGISIAVVASVGGVGMLMCGCCAVLCSPEVPGSS